MFNIGIDWRKGPKLAEPERHFAFVWLRLVLPRWKEMEDLVFSCFNREGSQVKGFVVAGGVLQLGFYFATVSVFSPRTFLCSRSGRCCSNQT